MRSIAAVLVRTAVRLRGSVSTAFRRDGPRVVLRDRRIEHLFYAEEPPRTRRAETGAMPPTYAELHSHTNFSFLHGASPVEDMVERAAELGLSGLASPTTTGCTAWCVLPPLRRRRGCVRSSGSRSSSRIRGAPDPARRRSSRRAGGTRSRAGRRSPEAADAGRGPAGTAPPDAGPPAGSSGGGQGGPARDRRAAARAAPRAAGSRRHGLSEPVPARLPRESRRDQARAPVHPGAARPAPRGPHRALGRSRRARSRAASWSATAPARGPSPSATRRSTDVAMRAATSGPSSSSSRTTCCPTTTGSSPSTWPSPTSSACRWS